MKVLYRKDYDKLTRCPGWRGSGIRPYFWEKKNDCNNGRLDLEVDNYNIWHFHTCKTCGITTLPYVTHFIDPDYILHVGLPNLKRNVRDYIDDITIKIDRKVLGFLYDHTNFDLCLNCETPLKTKKMLNKIITKLEPTLHKHFDKHFQPAICESHTSTIKSEE